MRVCVHFFAYIEGIAIIIANLDPAINHYAVYKAALYSPLFLVYPLSLIFSREPRLYKRVCPSVGPLVRWSIGPSVGPSVMLLSAGRDEPANNLFCVYELVSRNKMIFN